MISEYIVTKDILNLRSQPTDESADTFRGSLLKGTRVWLDDQDIIGTVPKGGTTNIWKKEVKSGNVVSKDGVSLDFGDYITQRFDGVNLIAPIDYNFILNIDDNLKKNKGEGITIGILDSSINKDLKFVHPVVRPFPVDPPNDGHGSFLAGIMAGSSGILGVVPNITLIELPLYDSNGEMTDTDKIFDYIATHQGPIILNVSQDIFSTPPLQEKFQNIKNAIVVASAGIDSLTEDDELNFPASLANVISVGALSAKFLSSNSGKVSFNKRLDFILPAFEYVSNAKTGLDVSQQGDTSSFAAAIVSAAIALLFSKQLTLEIKAVKQQLTGISKSYSDKNSFNFLNLINPTQ